MVSSYTSSLIDTTSILDRIIDLLTVELDITKEVTKTIYYHCEWRQILIIACLYFILDNAFD